MKVVKCSRCGWEILPSDLRRAYREVTGWLREGERGGGQIVARKATGKMAHAGCVRSATHGIQEALA